LYASEIRFSGQIKDDQALISVGTTYSLHDLLFDVNNYIITMPDLQSSDMRHIR